MTQLLPIRSSTERMATRPGTESSESVSRVGRLDGRTRIIGVRDQQGWRAIDGEPWTRVSVERLRSLAVAEVLLRRRFRRARVLLAWLPAARTSGT